MTVTLIEKVDQSIINFHANSYNIAIKTGNRLRSDHLVEKAFNEAKRLKIANTVTYNSYITAIDKCKQYDKVDKAFNDAVLLLLANTVTYPSYITAMDKFGQY